jgi:O-antigen ligase
MSRYGWDPHINRLLSTFFDPNFVGGFLAIVAIIVFASMLYEKKPETKALLFFGFTLLTACIVLTFSRSSYLTLAIGLLVIGFVKSWRTLLLIFIISLLAFTTIPRVRERVLGAVSLDVTAQARLVSFGQAFDIIKDYPIFGVGYNNLRSVRAEYGQITDSGQNHTAGGFDSSLLTIWATTGVLGLLAYLWLYVIMIYESFKAYHKSSHSSQKALGLGMGAGLVGLFVHSQIVNSFFYPHIFLYLWFLLAVLMAGKRVYANRY